MCSWRTQPPKADRILPYLFVGNWTSGGSASFLADHSISHVLNLTADAHAPDRLRLTNGRRNITRCQLAVRDVLFADITGYVRAAHAFIERARRSEERVLVHCHMGVSRACAIAIAHLMLSGGEGGWRVKHRASLEEAWKTVKAKRQGCLPNRAFFKQLQSLERELFGEDFCSMSEEDYDRCLEEAYSPVITSSTG